MDDAPASASRRDAAEIRLPADSLRRLSRLCSELGTGSIAALREAGRAAGRKLVESIAAGQGAGDLGMERFWTELDAAAAEAGFGRVGYRVVEADVGEVQLRASPEARAPANGAAFARGGCHFACGWIGGALSAAAGEPVAVLEVECAADGDGAACRFLVGAESRLREIRSSRRAAAAAARPDGGPEDR